MPYSLTCTVCGEYPVDRQNATLSHAERCWYCHAYNFGAELNLTNPTAPATDLLAREAREGPPAPAHVLAELAYISRLWREMDLEAHARAIGIVPA